MQTNLDDLISQAEAARIRNVSREAIYGLVARGKLQVTEIGGQKFLRRSEVENYTPEVGGRPPNSPAATTAKLNKAFRQAKEAEEAGKMTKAERGVLKSEAPKQARTKKVGKK